MQLMGKMLTVEEFAAANMVARIFPVEGFREQVDGGGCEVFYWSMGDIFIMPSCL